MTKTSILCLTVAASALFTNAAVAETELTVYTAFEAIDLARYAEGFN